MSSFLPTIWAGGDPQCYQPGSKIPTPNLDRLASHSLNGVFAIRRGDWKMIEGRGSGGFTNPKRLNAKQNEPQGQLYNLAQDPSEQRNVWDEELGTIQTLSKLLGKVQQISSMATFDPPAAGKGRVVKEVSCKFSMGGIRN